MLEASFGQEFIESLERELAPTPILTKRAAEGMDHTIQLSKAPSEHSQIDKYIDDIINVKISQISAEIVPIADLSVMESPVKQAKTETPAPTN